MTPTPEEMMGFSESIETLVYDSDDSYTYLEAIVEHCRVSGLEVEIAATLVHPALKAKIEEQSYALNMLKGKYNRLPI